MKFTELQAVYDGRKSFYGKAHLIESDEKVELQSYDTIVATYYKNDNKFVLHGDYSPTTLRHQKEFANQLGFDFKNKKELFDKYLEV